MSKLINIFKTYPILLIVIPMMLFGVYGFFQPDKQGDDGSRYGEVSGLQQLKESSEIKNMRHDLIGIGDHIQDVSDAKGAFTNEDLDLDLINTKSQSATTLYSDLKKYSSEEQDVLYRAYLTSQLFIGWEEFGRGLGTENEDLVIRGITKLSDIMQDSDLHDWLAVKGKAELSSQFENAMQKIVSTEDENERNLAYESANSAVYSLIDFSLFIPTQKEIESKLND